jgi:Right handed beta helix region
VRRLEPGRQEKSKRFNSINNLNIHPMKTSMKYLLVALIATPAAMAADLQVPADYPTIQAAVDAAANGDTIHIAAGVYTEQAFISGKKLTLIGQPGAILRAFPGMTRPISDYPDRPIIFVGDYTDVAIRGLTFEGERRAGAGGDYLDGILYVDSGGSVENCRFSGFRGQPSESGTGAAMFINNDLDDAPLVRVKVVGNTVVDSNLGLEIHGSINNPPRPSVEFTITDNTFMGIGPSSDEGNQGVAGIYLKVSTTGIVKDNIISGYSYSGPSGFNQGIGAQDTRGFFFEGAQQPMEPIVFEGNTLRDNQVHLWLLGGNGSTISNNTFEGSGGSPGMAYGADVTGGIGVSGTNVIIANNRFSGMERGILLVDSDFLTDTPADIGDFSGGRLEGNRFCDVANPIQYEPGATATEDGTLTCPFPDPTLDITRSVLLSWPWIDIGFAVESAPAADGPWSPCDATPFLQDDRHSVAVPTSGDERFFRLKKR